MNRGAILFFLLIAGVSSIAQPGRMEKQLRQEAERLYSEEQYNLAIQYYRELINLSDQNTEVIFQLAESYRKTFNYTEAEAYYLKAYYQKQEQFPLSLYYYALMLKLNGAFDESITFFSEFIAAHQQNDKLKDYVEQAIIDRAGSEMANMELTKKTVAYPLKSESFNTSFNDYAPALIDTSTLVITSGRVESNRQSIDERYGEGFTDNFYFTKNGNGWQDRTKQVFNITNTRYNDGSGSFNSKGDKYYYTVCGRDGPHCRIYRTEFRNNKWLDPVALNENINWKSFESKHPAVSHGGDTLLFSSNRSGGFGNYDLWMSINSGNENWGPAINMGSSINTKLNELSPAFTRYANIFFMASDGHQNYGGLDLYMAKRLSNGTTELYNLDYPFNSNRDDCFLSVTENKIYFSSNREGGNGGFDIYTVPVPSVISFTSRLSLKKKGARSDVKLNARLEKITTIDLITARNEDRIEYENLTYEKKKLVDKMVMNQADGYKQNNQKDVEGLTSSELELLTRIAEAQCKTLELEKRFKKNLLAHAKSPAELSQEVLITGLLLDSLSGNAISSRKILLMDELGEVIKVTVTNALGKFRFTDIHSVNHLYLRLEQLPDKAEKPKIADLSVTAYENETVSFENIYFDFDHYRLRSEAEQVLNELADYLKNSPSAQVDIYAYADDIGADNYNLALSQRRGERVLSYLIGKGVDQTALAVIAKGKQKNSSTQIEIQRQYNRRVEFYINGTTVTAAKKNSTYILKRKNNWSAISLATGVTVEDLKSLNGTTLNELQLYQPVRIPLSAKEIPEEMFFTIH